MPGIGMSPQEAEIYRFHRNYCYQAIGLGHHETQLGAEQRRALDVGCGNGVNLDVLLERGWDAEGIDPNREQVDVLVSRGKSAAVADLEQAVAEPERRGRYLLVTMLHVIEHLSDPLALIRATANLLAAGGVLVFETPLCCDLANRDHLFFFSGTSLYILLEKAGFFWQSHFMYVAHGHAHDNIIVLASRA